MAMICILFKGADDERNIKQDEYFVDPHFPPDNKFLFLLQSQLSAVFCADFECIPTSLLLLPVLVLQSFTGLEPDKGSDPECFLSCVCFSQVIECCFCLRSWNNCVAVFTCFRYMFAFVLFQVLTFSEST